MSATPGPWEVLRRFSNGCEIVPRITCAADSDRGCGWIADLVGAPYLGHESTLPNAHLIAAAPELLAACEEAFKELNEIRARDGVPRTYDGRKSDVDPEYFSSVVDGLSRAIARAKGAGP